MNKKIIRKPKEPWFAVNLSVFFPGIGQIYASRVLRGCVIIFIQIFITCFGVCLLLIPRGNLIIAAGMLLPLLIVYVWNFFDAYKCTKKVNTIDFEKSREKNKDPWLAVFLSQILPGLGHMHLKKWCLGIIFVICLIILSIIEYISLLFLFLGSIFKAFVCYHAYIISPFHREKSKNLILILVFIVFISGLICRYSPIFIKENVVQAYKIPSGGMLETLQIGDRLLVNKFIYSFKEPKRGDIIVFKFPKDPKRDFIKRLIGLPGETFEIKDKKVFIDGEPLDEPYVVFKDPDNLFNKTHPAYYTDPYARYRDIYEPRIITENGYFMMGDNRDFSQDSRYFGFVDKDLIKDKAYKIYWPLDRQGPIE